MTNHLHLQGPVCPLPLSHDEKIILGHGSGGRLTRDLIRDIFVGGLREAAPQSMDDAALLELLSE